MATSLGDNPFSQLEDIDGDPSLLSQLLAPLKLDRRTLVVIPYLSRNTYVAVVLMVITALLDFTGYQGFNLRLSIFSGGKLSFLHPIIQPVFLILAAWLIRKSVQLMGNDVKTIQVYRLLGYSQIWTVVSWLLLLLINVLSIAYPTVLLMAFVTSVMGYFLTLILGLTSARSFGDYLTVFMFMLIYLAIGLFFPLFLIGLFLS